jgi:antitoxin component of MazEF toxin-antitoxin module
MIALQRLTRNGNSSTVTIKKGILEFLGWLPGHYVLVELREDKTIVLRAPTADDISVLQRRPMVDQPQQGTML